MPIRKVISWTSVLVMPLSLNAFLMPPMLKVTVLPDFSMVEVSTGWMVRFFLIRFPFFLTTSVMVFL